eukprot:scaffold21008_cov101-Skeletonema_dohrnii-CCMP3373.AAC.2
MANYDGSLEAVDCHINSVRYDMVLESKACGRLSASSGHTVVDLPTRRFQSWHSPSTGFIVASRCNNPS